MFEPGIVTLPPSAHKSSARPLQDAAADIYHRCFTSRRVIKFPNHVVHQGAFSQKTAGGDAPLLNR